MTIRRGVPRFWSVRQGFRAATLVLGILALAAAAGLMSISHFLHRAADTTASALESVRAGEQLETTLLLYDRSARTAADHDGALATHAERQLRRWLDVAHQHVANAEEAALVEATDEAIEEHLALVGRPAREEGSPPRAIPPERADAMERSLHRALGYLEALVELNVEQSAAAHRKVRSWDKVADVAGLVVAATLLGAVALLLMGVQRYYYRPLMEIREAIGRFGVGDGTARATEDAPEELAEIAHTFNDAASRLGRQKEAQLTFLAGVAHDLRNPLAALRLSASVVSPDRPLPGEDRIRRLLELVKRQVERIDRMLEDLMDASRIEAGRFELRLERRDLRAIAEECIELFTEAAPQHLQLRLPADPVVAACDPARVAQVLNNLVSNAVKYSPPRSRVEIAVAAGPAGDVAIEVSDEGPGITPEDLEHVFEPFRRGTRGDDTISGVGLGLSVARRIVEAHGGKLEAESAVGSGSTFRVRLPKAS